MITCFIRHEITPFERDAFVEHARNWGTAIPRRAADLSGHFTPHQGSNRVPDGTNKITSLATYEAYRTRLAAAPAGCTKFALLRGGQSIRRNNSSAPRVAPRPDAPRRLP